MLWFLLCGVVWWGGVGCAAARWQGGTLAPASGGRSGGRCLLMQGRRRGVWLPPGRGAGRGCLRPGQGGGGLPVCCAGRLQSPLARPPSGGTCQHAHLPTQPARPARHPVNPSSAHTTHSLLPPTHPVPPHPPPCQSQQCTSHTQPPATQVTPTPAPTPPTTLSISSVVTPGATAAAAASSTRRPMAHASRMPATSRSVRNLTAGWVGGGD